MATGSPEACAALAEYFSFPNRKLTADDVIVDHGGSGAIWTVLNAITAPGDNILVPAPGFPLYEAICLSRGVNVKKYKCLP